MLWICGQKLGKKKCPYLRRWVFQCSFFSIRLHHWLGSDDPRHFHDHPWWYISVVLWGSYTDRSPRGYRKRRWGSVKKYPATHTHTVMVDKPCWTLLITGPEKRVWGFWVNGKFKKRNRYFYDYGHYPCD